MVDVLYYSCLAAGPLCLVAFGAGGRLWFVGPGAGSEGGSDDGFGGVL